LRKDGDGHKEDRKRPQDFVGLEIIVEDETENETRSEEVFNFECIDGGVVGGSGSRTSAVVQHNQRVRGNAPEPDLHEIEDIAGAANEEQLHGEVVQGNPTP
jgi:hypothetical protein